MDSGRFESVLKPYKFHQVMRSLFVPLRLATDARRLEFITDLDTSIDDVRSLCRRADTLANEQLSRWRGVHCTRQWASQRMSSSGG